MGEIDNGIAAMNFVVKLVDLGYPNEWELNFIQN